LSRVPLFSRLNEDEQADLAGLLKTHQAEPSRPIFWIGEVGADFFIIQHGHVAICVPDEQGKEMTLATLGPGQFFGELSLLDSGPRTATARPVAKATLLSLDQADFHRFLRRHPEAAIHMLAVLAQRQREMVERLRGIRNVNEVVRERQTRWGRLTEHLASITSSELFVLANLVFFALWITVNHLRGKDAFDPEPFGLLGLIVTVEGLLVTLIVLISQNRQAERDRIRADLDYQVSLKDHLEVMQMHQKIDRLLMALNQEPPEEGEEGS
jgi:uncharacterized membrane protein